jgi:hypothetical protein
MDQDNRIGSSGHRESGPIGKAKTLPLMNAVTRIGIGKA